MHAPPPASPVPVVDSVATLFASNLPLIRAVVRAVCHRYRVHPSDREDFASSALIKLLDDDYAVLRRFRGDGGGLRTFLWAVVSRHLLDVRIREWGKWRSSRCARRLGSAAVYLEDLIYRQQTPVREAVAMVSHHPRWTLSTTKVCGLYAQLPTRVPRRRSEPLDETNERVVHARIHGDHATRKDDAAGVREALLAALHQLDSSERRLLRLRFQRGLSIKQIAAETGADVHALYRRLPKVLARLRRELQARQVDARDVSALLGHLGDDLDSVLMRTWVDRGVGTRADRSTFIDGRTRPVSRVLYQS